MKFQNLKILILSSLVSLITIFIYDQFRMDEQIIIREKQPDASWVKLQEREWSATRNISMNAETPSNFVDICRRVTPSVVSIKSVQNIDNAVWGETYVSTSGSGVIVSKDGYIVTNSHVIEDGSEVEVVLDNRKSFKAEIIGKDPSTDIALLRINADQSLPYLIFGDSDHLDVGEWVLAVGNPFELQSTVTAGIVSAKARDIDILDNQHGVESFIQTDAAVNQGNSGGALINTRGELVGINTAIITYSGRYEGYSFAIPINLVRKVISDLKIFGQVHRGLLGVEALAMNAEIAKAQGIGEVKGVIVSKVSPNSGAYDAQIKAGDIILKIDDYEINALPELAERIARKRPGDSVEVDIIRRNKRLTKKVELRNYLNTNEIINIRKDELLKDLGFEVRDLIKKEKQSLKISAGIKVVSIYKGSIIERTKMEPGFVITHINENKVKDSSTFLEILEKAKGRVVLQGVYESYEGPFWYVFSR